MKKALLYSGLILTGCAGEPFFGASTHLDSFAKLPDKACVREALTNSSEIQVSGENKSADANSEAILDQKGQRTNFRINYEIPGFTWE